MNDLKTYAYFTVERRYTNYIVFFLQEGKYVNKVNLFILSDIIGEK